MPTMRKGSPTVYPGITFQCHSYAYAAMLLQYGVSLLRRMMRLAPPSPPLEARGWRAFKSCKANCPLATFLTRACHMLDRGVFRVAPVVQLGLRGILMRVLQ